MKHWTIVLLVVLLTFSLFAIPAFATSRINFVVPTATGYEVVYIDANTRELRITNKVTQQIFTNMIIPVGPARY